MEEDNPLALVKQPLDKWRKELLLALDQLLLDYSSKTGLLTTVELSFMKRETPDGKFIWCGEWTDGERK